MRVYTCQPDHWKCGVGSGNSGGSGVPVVVMVAAAIVVMETRVRLVTMMKLRLCEKSLMKNCTERLLQFRNKTLNGFARNGLSSAMTRSILFIIKLVQSIILNLRTFSSTSA